MHAYDYPRPALTVDAVIFGFTPEKVSLEVLLIKRLLEPYKDQWALPGGFVHVGESLEEAVRRELQEEAGLSGLYMEQLATFGEPKRDPREHTVSVAYFALVQRGAYEPKGGTDAKEAAWFKVDKLPKLAFDHELILSTALARLRGKVRYQPLGFELLPELFPLRMLQQLYETIIGQAFDKRNFRKKLLSMGILRETDEFEEGISRRPAKLYAFDRWNYERMVKKGFNFEL